MDLSVHSLLIILLIGIVAGWLAGKVVRGGGFGLIGDLVVGIAGAFIASWLFPKFGVHIGTGVGEQIVYAMMGSIILLLLLRLIRRA
ncbi:MAG: GlsB/YeaQ/YmgE family stress response membrane protein [Proteobacteria bacterium]|nr:GlsB/YeaQ/YmgE family stress response membrane protein [Pseudomonadota bacterium]